MDNINVILYKGLKNYFSTLFNYGEMDASNTNKLLVLKYIKDLLSSGRVFTYKQTNIIQAVVRCLAGTSCLLEVPKAIIKNSYTPSAPAQKEESYIDAIKLLQEEYETLSNEMKTKQSKLIAGDNITIQNNVISADIPDGAYIIDVDMDADPMTTTAVFADALAAFESGRQVWFAGTSGGDLVFSVPMTLNYGGIVLAGFTWIDNEQQMFTFTANGVSFIQTDYVNTTALSTALAGKQDVLTFDNVPTQSSNNPVKSGGVYDAFSTYCPIIEDTRSSAVATITGVAPFATLQDGQMIMLNLNKNTTASSTLELTLSNGSSTGAIAIKHLYNGNFWQLDAGKAYARNTTLPLIYRESLSAWVVLGSDSNTTYPTITQAQIDAGTATTATTVTPKIIRDNFYLKQEVNNLCPIIEDTRSSAVANITGVAPFASLVDGQMIVLHFAYRSAASSTLTLTLSGGDTTATIPIYKHSYNNVSQLGYNLVREDTFYILIYQASASKWWIVGCIDKNTTYGIISQAEIDAGTNPGQRVISPKLLCDNFDKVTTLVDVTATGDVTQALDSGKFYRFGEVDSLTLTFTAPSAGLGMWGGKFTASANWSALGIPATIDEAAGNDTIAGGKTYEFNVLDGIIVVKEV